MASRMTRAVAKDDNAMYSSLREVAALFDRAQQQVFKLMAGVSILVTPCLKAVADSLWLYRILFLNLSARRNISRSPAIFLRTRGTAIRASREARAGDTTTELHHRWGYFPINWISGPSFIMGLV